MSKKEQIQLLVGSNNLTIRIIYSGTWNGPKLYENLIFKTFLKVLAVRAFGPKKEKQFVYLNNNNHVIFVKFSKPFKPGQKYFILLELDIDPSIIIKFGSLNILNWPQEKLFQIAFLPDAGSIFFSSALAKIEKNPINEFRLLTISRLASSLTSHIKKKSAIRIEWGIPPKIRLKFNYLFKNIGNVKATNIKIITHIPPKTRFQDTFTFSDILIKNDYDGNKIALFEIDDINEGKTRDKSFNVDIELNGNMGCILPTFGSWDQYIKATVSNPNNTELLKPSKYWNVNNENIKNLIENLKKKANDASEYIKLAFEFVNQNISYSINNMRDNAANTLEDRKGDCSEFSDLFVTLLRGADIPAKIILGWVYNPGEKKLNPHAWCELYTPNFDWIQCDPTMGYLTGVTCQHVCRQREGIVQEQNSYAYGFIGKTKISVKEEITLEFL